MLTALIATACVFALAGAVSLLAAICNWDWFFKSANVRMLTFGLKRPYQRLIYGFCGLAMAAMAGRMFADAAAM